MYNGQSIAIDNFSGGMCSNIPETKLALNQAKTVDNIVIRPNGMGIRSRRGNKAFNATAMTSGANVQGIGYFKTSAGSNYLMSVCGAKVYKSDSLDGTMDDITGTVTITAGADNHWDIITFNDVVYGFGGPKGNPDAAWKWNGTGNATVLTGNPSVPLQGALTANNRVFGWAGSTIYWTIIGNAEDWSGTGSGSAVIGSLNDNENITGAIIISTNYMLVFKENSVHQMVISSAPFPGYSLFDTIGSAGHYCSYNIDGIVYFLGTDKRMYSTNGETITEYPDLADNVWDTVLTTRLPYVIGFLQSGSDYSWMVWLTCSSGSTNNLAIIFDLKNKCWLQCTKGYNFNIAGFDESGNVYLGGYNGKIYTLDYAARYYDESEGDATTGAITAYWTSGWITPDKMDMITQVHKITTAYDYKASGNLTLKYGFDGTSSSASYTMSQTQSGSATYLQDVTRISGRGNTFQYQLYGSSGTIDWSVHKLILSGKSYGQKDQSES